MSDLPEIRFTGQEPEKATPGSAGYDLRAAKAVVVPARGRVLVPTGLRVAIAGNSYYFEIRSRSGLSLKHGIEVGAGIIDSDYRGEIGVVLHNHSDVDFAIAVNDRIAQMILHRNLAAKFVAVETLDETQRGTGGFGSTGV
jgi:dUTP pyrophosphatase